MWISNAGVLPGLPGIYALVKQAVLRDSNDVLDTESSIEINRYTNNTIPLVGASFSHFSRDL